jgi:hypothetical protein
MKLVPLIICAELALTGRGRSDLAARRSLERRACRERHAEARIGAGSAASRSRVLRATTR